MSFKVLVCDSVAKKGVEYLKSKGFDCLEASGKTEDEIAAMASQYDAIIVRSATKITPKILKSGNPKLKVVGRAGVGYDNINVEAASENGVIVMNSPLGSTVSVAELAVALTFSIARKIHLADAKMKKNVWDKKSFMGHELNGKTAGIIGGGRIGIETGKRFKAFNMKVLCYDPYITDSSKVPGFELVSLDRLISESDVISLHIPKTKETTGIINLEAIKKMKKNVIIINCARGGTINETELLEALNTMPDKILGVGLDVFETEPPVKWDLINHEKVCATPHVGASTKEAQELVAVQICEQIVEALTNNKYTNAVNLDKVKK